MSYDGYTYPSTEQLERIRTWDVGGYIQPALELLEFVKGLWWAAEWGWSEYDDDGSRHYILSTGGWSGNESLMDALSDNRLFWLLAFRTEHRGGHYHLAVRVE